jgi:hypothetical protein
MGGKTSSAELCRAVDRTIIDKLDAETRGKVAYYVDDFAIGGVASKEKGQRISKYLERVDKVWSVMRAAGWSFKLDSLRVAVPELEWVGQVFVAGGTMPSAKLVETILKCPDPTTTTEMRRFMGVAIQFKDRIERFGEHLAPLAATIRQGKAFTMTPEATAEVEFFKTTVAALTVQVIIDPKSSKPIQTHSDASKSHIGGWIAQGGLPGGFYSQPLSKTQASWAPLDRELLGAHAVLRHYEPLFGKAFVQHLTDHKPLEQWRTLQVEPIGPNGEMRSPLRKQWISDIDRLNVEIKWVPGALHVLADAMTRPPFAVSVANWVETSAVAWTNADWRREQATDRYIAAVKAYAEGQGPPLDETMAREGPLFAVDDGVVKRLFVPHGNASRSESKWLVWVPEGLAQEVLTWFHNKAGHMGETALAESIRAAGLYWRGYYSACKRFVGNCKACQATLVRKDKVGPLQPTLHKDLEGKRVLVLDYIGPLPEAQGMKYILLSMSIDDMWPEAEALPAQSVAATIKHLQRRANAEGAMDALWSDRGSTIIGAAAQAFFEDYGLESRTTTSNNHQGAGAIEAQVKKFMTVLKKMAEDHNEWPERVEGVLAVMRNDDCVDMKSSPFENRFHRKMKLPAHLRFGLQTKTVAAERQQQIMRDAKERADQAALEQKARYDVGRKSIDFTVGQKVWWWDHYKGKLDWSWRGPFVVAAKKSDLSYELMESDGGPKMGRRYTIVNARDLKRYDIEEQEMMVKAIEDHGIGQDGWKFKVRWSDGDVTWEPVKNLYDVKRGGWVVYTEKLREYAKDNGIKLVERVVKRGDVVK